MSRMQKLIADFTRSPSPKDFAWDDVVRILRHFGYEEIEGSGSRKKFVGGGKHKILLHKRHPDSTLLAYQIEAVVDALKLQGHIK